MTNQKVIGKDNEIPWHIPEELQYFKSKTIGKPIIMGRKTFDSIGRRLLPGRKTIILTRDETGMKNSAYIVASSIDEALIKAGYAEEVMIIGGAKIYEQFLSKASKLYLSIIRKNYEGDTYFPIYNNLKWKLVFKSIKLDFTIKTFERR